MPHHLDQSDYYKNQQLSLKVELSFFPSLNRSHLHSDLLY